MRKSAVRILSFLLIMASLLTYSCNSQTSGWSEKEKKDFLKGCVNASKGRLSEEQSKDFCDCMLNKVMADFPNFSDLKKKKKSEMMEKRKEWGKACLAELKAKEEEAAEQ